MQRGETVGDRFQILRLSATGGMGEVYQAIDKESGDRVAVKILPDHRGADAARFAREGRILADLRHPEIVRYLAHGVLASGAPYLAMEWLDGEDLAARLARGRLAVRDAVAMGIRVADALGFAHARGVIHRDLKPSNVFLVEGRIDAVKLLDFGIAQVSVTSRVTRSGMIVGTPAYMAPEQARTGEALSAQADVFSLGCVLFECLTGRRAFTGSHLMAVLARILFDEPPSVEERRADVPDALARLIRRMLAKAPEDRPRDGAAVATALRAIEVSAAGDGPPSSLPQRTLTGIEQRAVAVILVGPPRPGAPDLDPDALAREAEIHGARLEILLDGTAVVMLRRAGVATDLAAQAVGCAFALRRHAPGRAVALAMGRGASEGLPSMGITIERAVRLVEAAPADAALAPPIALDEITAGLLGARFDVRAGEAGFVLHGERDLADGTRTLLGKATPLVGRDWELGALEQLFDESAEEREARIALVTGVAGIGKSRLLQELLRRIKGRAGPAHLWTARADALRAGSAFGLLAQVVRAACGIQGGELASDQREKIVAAAGARSAPFLGEILAIPFPDDDDLKLRAARRDAPLMTDQMSRAFLGLVAAACADRPVVIALEDIHWSDRPTVHFLDRTLRDLWDAPLFIVALGRPEVYEIFPRIWGDRRIQEIRLKELSKKAIDRLARHVLGDVATPAMVDRLGRLSEGNAFYLEELIRSAAEGRSRALPETVVAMVRSRLGALDEDARRLLRAASVFGETFWQGGVQALIGRGSRADGAPEKIRALADRELVAPRPSSRFPGEIEYAFRHALIREGAYAMLTDRDRALGHKLAGEWLEWRGEEDSLVLADHHDKGGDAERAGRLYLRAAEKLSAGGDTPTAIAHLRRALDRPLSASLRVKLLGALCQVAFWHAESLSAVLPDAEDLIRIAPRESAPWAQGMLAKLNIAMRAGRFEEFRSTLDVLRDMEPRGDTAATLALAFHAGIYFLDISSRLLEADLFEDRLRALAADAKDRDPEVELLFRLLSSVRRGYRHKDPWAALEHSRAAVKMARDLGHPRYLVAGQLGEGRNLWLLGAIAEAERTMKDIAMPDGETGYDSSVRPFCLAWMLADRGAIDEARGFAAQLVEAGQRRRLPLTEGLGRWALGEVLRRAGDLPAAEVEIDAAVGALRVIRPFEATAARVSLAALRLAQNRPEEALAAVEEARAAVEAIGACSMTFRDAFLHVTHAECLEATGDRAGARAAIALARAFVIGVADRIGDAAYRRSFLESVPENRRILDLTRAWLGED